MSFEWLRMRIQEEQDRRQRESEMLDRLPQAMEELHGVLKQCTVAYAQSFGDESVDIHLLRGRIKVTVREFEADKWQTTGKVEVVTAPDIPGFQIQRGEYSLAVEVGLLPSNKLFYRDCEQDKYLTLDDLTKRVLDRALFPKLRE
jgi:hypothetical protein